MTTYTGPTPEERNLAKADFLLARPGEPTGDNWALGFEYGWALGCRRAKAEDAPLLEAAKAVHGRLLYTNFERVLTPEQTADLAEWNSALGKAIAQARKE